MICGFSFITASRAAPGTFSRLPVERSSSTATSQPASRNRSAIVEPMNPAPPVIRIRFATPASPGRVPRRVTVSPAAPAPSSDLLAEPGDRPAHALVERDPRLPAEDLLRARDVRLSHLGIVLGQRPRHDRDVPPDEPLHRLRELEDRELVRVPDVHRLLIRRVEEPPEPL